MNKNDKWRGSVLQRIEGLYQRIRSEIRNRSTHMRSAGGENASTNDHSDDLDFDLFREIQCKSPYMEHTLSIDQLVDIYPLSRINTLDPKSSLGVRDDEAKNACKEHGLNIIKPNKQRKCDRLRYFYRQFLNKFRILLLIAAIACLLVFALDVSRVRELAMSMVLMAVILIMGISSYIEHNKIVNQINGYRRIVTGDKTTVIREGRETTTEVTSLVKGDLVRIRSGETVPADCRLIYTNADFKVESSWISGEPDAINYTARAAQKSKSAFESQNIVFCGCSCISGEALGIVIRIGNCTLLGQLAQLSSQEKRKSRLEIEYGLFSKSITLISLLMATGTFLIGLALNGFVNFNTTLINGFFTIIIANIPQGLPVIMAAQLIIVARRLAKMGMFLKRADIADNLGLTSALLVDKSTLLTQTQMRLVNLWYNRRLVDSNELSASKNLDRTLDEILDVISVCDRTRRNDPLPTRNAENLPYEKSKSATLEVFSLQHHHYAKKPASTQSGTRTIDDVLAEFVEGKGVGVNTRRAGFELLFELPFSANRRFHLAIVRRRTEGEMLDEEEDQPYLAMITGAPEEIFRSCGSVRGQNGEDEEITDQITEEFENTYSELAREGKSCIGFATMEFQTFDDLELTDLYELLFDERNWSFLGMVAVFDPPQAQVADAVKRAEEARIRLFLVTGDHPQTAEALARQIGFYTSPTCPPTASTSFGSLESLKTSSSSMEKSVASGDSTMSTSSVPVIHGDQVLSDEEWRNVLRHRHAIFARVTPIQKVQLIKHCHRLNYMVAMTGDGLMDAKPLKQADAGIATKMNGSVFAKEAADIVSTLYDLPNVVKSIAETRLLFDNLRKTLAYTLSHLLPELLSVLIAFICGMPMGLNSLQVLTIDLMTEIPPSVALIFEPAERDTMKRAPRKRTSRLVTPALLGYSYFIAGNIIALGCLFSYFSVFWYHGLSIRDLVFTSNSYWHIGAPDLKASLSGALFNDLKQMRVHEEASAAWQIALIGGQIFNLLSCTTRRVSFVRYEFKNPLLFVAILLEILILLALLFVPGVNWLVGVRAPPPFVWFIPFGSGILLLLTNEVRKLCIRRGGSNSPLVRMIRW